MSNGGELKTIKINQEFMSKGSGKRSGTASSRKSITPSPLVTSGIKNRLLNRIRNHKARELSMINAAINTAPSSSTKQRGGSSSSKQMAAAAAAAASMQQQDEFDSATNYFSSLSRIRPVASKTVKNYSTSTFTPQPQVSLDFPDELMYDPPPTSPGLNYSTMTLHPQNQTKRSSQPPLTSTIIHPEPPFGVLKGGQKPSYRVWMKTAKNHERVDDDLNSFMTDARPPTPPKRNSSPYPFNESDEQEHMSISSTASTISKNAIKEKERELDVLRNRVKNSLDPTATETGGGNNTSQSPSPLQHTIKRTMKHTYRRKMKLGKSLKTRSIGVLIKNVNTRKQVVKAQQELKRIPITDVRKYLRQHGLLKTGSTAPNDILRKMFECAMMSGDVTNVNKDTLLHNLLQPVDL